MKQEFSIETKCASDNYTYKLNIVKDMTGAIVIGVNKVGDDDSNYFIIPKEDIQTFARFFFKASHFIEEN